MLISNDQVKEGQMIALPMADVTVLLARVEGKVYAINNKCTHLGCKLSEGQLAGRIVTCPCHGSKFDITTGEVVQYVSNWPRIAGKLLSYGLMKDAEVFAVALKGDQLEISAIK